MLPQRLPGPVHPDALQVVAARWRRVLPWLWAVTVVQVLVAAGGVLGVLALATTVRGAVGWSIVVGLPTLAAWVHEFRQDTVRNPRNWTYVAPFAAFVPGAVLGGALGMRYHVVFQLTGAVGAFGALALVWWMHHRAYMPLRSGLVPAMARSSFVLSPMLDGGWWTGSTYHSMILSADRVTWLPPSVPPLSGRYHNEDLELGWITRVQRCGTGVVTKVETPAQPRPRRVDLAVPEPQVYAELLRERVQQATGRALPAVTTTRTQPGVVDEALLPAPAPRGAPAQPVPPPTTRTRSPWSPVLGLTLALVGIVGVPATTLWVAAHAWAGAPPAKWAILVAAYLLLGATLLRHRPNGWWPLAATASLYAGIGISLDRPESAHAWVFSPGWLFGGLVGSVVLARVGARLAGRAHPFHARTRTRISVGSRRRFGVLACEGERLVLGARSNRHGRRTSLAMALTDVELVQPGEFAEPGEQWWPLPGAMVGPHQPGPGLRIVGGGQQWLVALADPTVAAEIIKARARRASKPPPPRLAHDEWRAVQSWYRSVDANPTEWILRINLALVVGVVLLEIAAPMIVANGTSNPAFRVPGLLLAAATAVLVVWQRRWWRFRRAQLAVLPADSPPWGEQRTFNEPTPGWRPWSDYSDLGRSSTDRCGSGAESSMSS